MIMNRRLYKNMLTLLAATSLLAGCSGDDAFNGNGNVNGNNSNAITFNTNVNNFISKATTYDNVAALQTEGSFTCTAYNATTTTAFIEPTTVSWNSGISKWQFAQNRYWPGASGLDFFAYMPATKPTYISSISYPSARSAQFVCNLSTEQPSEFKEFVCALATDKTQANSPDGVSMQFKHHFAKLLFKLDPESGSNVKINHVTISGIKMSGTCTFNGTTSSWAPSGDNSSVRATAIDGATPYLVIPNTYAIGAVTITVNATWTSISGVTTDKTATNKYELTWQPGYSYLFTLTLSGDALEVNTEKWAEQW